MKRVIGVAALSAVFLVIIAPAAFARGNGWSYAPASPFTLPASVCGVEVNVTFPVDREYIETVSQTDTTLVLRETGALVETFTNTETGQAVTVNASGPGTFRVDLRSGIVNVVGSGTWTLFFLSPDQVQFGVSGIMLISGRFTDTLDTNTNDVSALSYVGETTDLCEAVT